MMDIEKRLNTLENFVKWQAQKVSNRTFQANDRTRLAVWLIDLALEHERSIGVLVRENIYGSALALVRPLFESYIRAVWLRNCAEEADIERFKRGKLDRIVNSLISDIEKLAAYDVQVLSGIKNRYWAIMSDFTHGGIVQALGRNSGDFVAPNYPEENKIGVINFAISVGLWLTMEIAIIVADESFMHETFEKINAYSSKQ